MKIGFVGTGKIASAVIEAICTSELNDYEIFVSPRNEIKSRKLENQFSRVKRSISNQDVLDNSEIVLIALKPDIYEHVLSGLSFRKEQLVVSLIPFSTHANMLRLVAPADKITRATPLPTVVNHICPIQVYNSNPEVNVLLECIGQVLDVKTEEQLHTIWTLTCLISPYYDLMSEISNWAVRNSVDKHLADKYVADMFNSLAFAASKNMNPDFSSLSSHAATPGGLNEWTAKEIARKGANVEYTKAADYILSKFQKD